MASWTICGFKASAEIRMGAPCIRFHAGGFGHIYTIDRKGLRKLIRQLQKVEESLS